MSYRRQLQNLQKKEDKRALLRNIDCLYSGIPEVTMKNCESEGQGFRTFLSASTDRNVAVHFKNKLSSTQQFPGVILRIDKSVLLRNPLSYCDVSWISPFDEKEILIGDLFSFPPMKGVIDTEKTTANIQYIKLIPGDW